MIWHPSRSRLNDLADQELNGRLRERTAAHVAKCRSCQRTLASIRELTQQAQSLPLKTPRPELLGQILARNQAGDRVELPTNNPLRHRSVARPMMVAATLVLLAGVGLLFVVSSSDLGAELTTGELHLTPQKPRTGDRITVEYRATSMLSGEERLVLRARYRRPGDRAYNDGMQQIVVGELSKKSRRKFAGTFILPDSVVYAVFAVEDSAIQRVDSNGRKLWELMTHDDTGKPEYRALVQKQNDLIGRNWEAAFETARIAAELYPLLPDAWVRLNGFEAALASTNSIDSLRARHSQRFARLQTRSAAQPSLDDDDIAGMYLFALTTQADPSTIRYWRERLLAQAPEHSLAIELRVQDNVRQYGRSKDRLLIELEGLWSVSNRAHVRLARQGFRTALAAQDIDGIVRWADRRIAIEPWTALEIARRMGEVSELRSNAVEQLQAQLLRIDDETTRNRDLYVAVGEQEGRDETRRNKIRVPLGKMLVETGEIEAGQDMLMAAAASGWDPSASRIIADIRLQVADTAGAIEMLARVAVDPNVASASADSTIAIAAELINREQWEQAAERARLEMWRRALAQTINKSISRDVELLDSTDQVQGLHELAAGRITLLAFHSSVCAPCRNELPLLQTVADRLEVGGGRVLIVTHNAPSADVRALISVRRLPIFQDVRGMIRQALGLWETPMYVILDKSVRLRFVSNSLNDVMRVAEALASTSFGAIARR